MCNQRYTIENGSHPQGNQTKIYQCPYEANPKPRKLTKAPHTQIELDKTLARLREELGRKVTRIMPYPKSSSTSIAIRVEIPS